MGEDLRVRVWFTICIWVKRQSITTSPSRLIILGRVLLKRTLVFRHHYSTNQWRPDVQASTQFMFGSLFTLKNIPSMWKRTKKVFRTFRIPIHVSKPIRKPFKGFGAVRKPLRISEWFSENELGFQTFENIFLVGFPYYTNFSECFLCERDYNGKDVTQHFRAIVLCTIIIERSILRLHFAFLPLFIAETFVLLIFLVFTSSWLSFQFYFIIVAFYSMKLSMYFLLPMLESYIVLIHKYEADNKYNCNSLLLFGIYSHFYWGQQTLLSFYSRAPSMMWFIVWQCKSLMSLLNVVLNRPPCLRLTVYTRLKIFHIRAFINSFNRILMKVHISLWKCDWNISSQTDIFDLIRKNLLVISH